ncbi:MAG: hypothetical protein JXJ22_04910 [Bacteroidales bacterium]|nr:hypothetical protein [Bacteroidales bacterium]
MKKRRITIKNRKILYVVAIAIIIVAFLLLGGGPWTRGIMHGGRWTGITHWNWALILISLGAGFLLGLVVSRRKW